MTNAFDQFMRSWCERQGWPWQPEMAAKDVNAYWASVEGTDEWELAQLDRACEDEVND